MSGRVWQGSGGRGNERQSARRGCAAMAALLCALAAQTALAGTTGKLAGTVRDSQMQPVPGASVSIAAYRTGAATELDGHFIILNLPPGRCDVRISRIGYRTVMITGVEITPDKTTQADATLQDTSISMQEVVVRARAPVVDVRQTSSVQSISRTEISKLPVQEMNDVVNLQAGVVEGHFRGGRLGEVQFQVDGVSINNPYNNQPGIRIDRSLLQELQVISGTFDAEYGSALSGVVNAVLRRGTEKVEWNAEAYSGGFVYSAANRLTDFQLRPSSLQNFQASLSGPLAAIPSTYFLVSGSRHYGNDYTYAERRFLPTDNSDTDHGIFRPTGDSAEVPLGYQREWSGLAKLTNRSLANIEISYQLLLDGIETRANNWAWRYNPEGLSRQHTWSFVHGLDWTHTLDKSTVYRLSLRQNYFRYKDMLYDDVYDARYDSAGPAISSDRYVPGAVIQGADFTRFLQQTSTLEFKGSLTHQSGAHEERKLGFELQSPQVEFGSPGVLQYVTESGKLVLKRHVNEAPDFPGVQSYRPLAAAAFMQENLEWNDLNVRVGARLDYFDARSTIPSDLENPANSIAGSPQSSPVATTVKVNVSPRIGVSYPVTDRSALHFAYGHFYQMPSLGDIFGNADYSVLKQLQAGGTSYGTLGNPDIRPQKTVQYQFGYKNAFSEKMGMDLTVFYKDIRDLLGVAFQSTYNDAEYARFTNVDFGDVLGFTLSLSERGIGPLSGTIDYTWQMAQGNSSDPRETATRAAAGEDSRPRQVPFDWDQRHTLNVTLGLSEEGVYEVGAIFHAVSGLPYTPELAAGFGGGLEKNSGRRPAGTELDLRAEKNFSLSGHPGQAFVRVFNAADTRFFNGYVFPSSGSAFYSSHPSSSDAITLADPTRFFGPRRVEVGLSLRSN